MGRSPGKHIDAYLVFQQLPFPNDIFFPLREHLEIFHGKSSHRPD
jgi:hypothetical protein